nr:immunoglobulin heavy chain junction region [Mus musculus]
CTTLYYGNYYWYFDVW